MSTTVENILPIMSYLSKKDICDSIWWRCDGEYSPITFLVNCNDLFYWAQADCEELTIENLPILKKSINDCEKIDPVCGALHGCDLFCCRVRKMRPQQPAYPKRSEGLYVLFDACGPERDQKDEG